MNSSTEAVKYARIHGLSIDYLAEPPPTAHIETLQRGLPSLLTDDTSLRCIEFPIHVNSTEYFILDKGGAFLLQNAHNGLTNLEEIEAIMLPLLDFRRTKKLRVETALLRSDHVSDVRSFASWEDSHVRDSCLPSEPLDIEMDVGLEWPRRLKSLPSELINELKGEKLEVNKEELIYLQAKVKENWRLEDEGALWDKMSSYKKNSVLCPVTPPLLPMSPPSTSYIPSSPACHLPILSDPASLISQDLERVERAIFEEDTLTPPTQCYDSSSASSITISNLSNLKQSNIYLPLDHVESSNPSLTEPRVKADDRKVEVTLLPVTPIKESSKTVTFCETVSEMLLDSFSRPGERDSTLVDSEDEIDKFFQEAFRTAADETMRRIEQEQLQEADSKSRVAIPIMDFTSPDPPWIQLRKIGDFEGIQAARRTELMGVLEKCGLLQIWPGVKKLEPKLRWTVFPRELAHVALEESFGNEDVLNTFLGHSKDSPIIDSGGLTWKPLGFRILKQDEDDEEDEIQNGHFEEKQRQDIVSLVKKRKMLYDEESLFDARPSKISAKTLPIDPAMLENRNIEEIRRGKSIKRTASTNVSLDLGLDKRKVEQNKKQSTLFDSGIFSATDALDNYLQIRASKKQKPIGSVYFADQGAAENLPLCEYQGPAQESASIEQSQTIHQALPVPLVNIPTSPTPYVISSAILKHRILIRALNGLFPAAIPIERDFTAHNTTSWLPNSITRSPIPSALASEADLIISPSTGIILTTLQKIKQKPLPGQKAKSAFKGRIEMVSTRYERLIVLVSEGCDDEFANGLSELDTLALAEVIGFCSSLQTAVIVQFVAGGELTLAKWLVGAMVQYGIQGPASVPLLEDQTLWELFLRRAGLNAYAAQAIIATLKAPEGGNELGASETGTFGIAAFVKMGQEERRRIFGALLGGVRVLDAVGRVLDAEWI